MIMLNEPDISMKTYTCEQFFAENDSSDKGLDNFAESMTPGKPDDAKSQSSHRHNMIHD